jgi:hypothetical protein
VPHKARPGARRPRHEAPNDRQFIGKLLVGCAAVTGWAALLESTQSDQQESCS